MNEINSSELKKVKRKSSGIMSKVLSVLFTILLIGLITGTIVGAAFALYLRSFVDISIDDILLLSTDQDQNTQLYYMDYTDRANRIGEAVLIEDQKLSAGENRFWVSYSEMPDDLVNAFIAIEDKDFRDHKGVDWGRTLSATFYFFAPGDKHYGGSTITQQVIKNVTGKDEVTIQRKVQEIFMALNLEKKLDKSEIIEIYLNTIYLSQHSYGVQAASQAYFGKDVSELTLLECAAIACIPQAPTKWDPVQNPENNTDRRKVVLTAMRDQGYITEDEYLEAWHAELKLNTDGDDEDEESVSYNSWYTDQVIVDAIELLTDDSKLGLSKDVATKMVYTGGLKIYTLMDPHVQDSLEEVFENPEKYDFPKTPGTLEPKCAMVVIDPYTGDVLGLVGDKGVKTGDRLQNFATQTRRSPGSCIKPLSVYAPGIEEGVISYGTTFDDIPVNYGEDNESPWPSNAPDRYSGLTPVYDAVVRSVNTISIRVLEQLGTATSFEYVKNKLHIEGFLEKEELADGTIIDDKNASALALGGMSYGVTVEEMTAAYAMFANGGIYHKPRTILRITDNDGNVLVENEAESERVISESTAFIMTKIMEQVVFEGTAKNGITLDSMVNVAGKTGTTSNEVDKWFVGYTPYYVGGVWFGYEWNKSTDMFASYTAAGIWDKAMTVIHQDIFGRIDAGKEQLRYFSTNGYNHEYTKEFCIYSGKLATDACRADPRGTTKVIKKGYFTADTVPVDDCDRHVMVKICTDTDCIAGDNCPHTKEVSFIDYEREEPPEKAEVVILDSKYILDKDNVCKEHKTADNKNEPTDEKPEDNENKDKE